MEKVETSFTSWFVQAHVWTGPGASNIVQSLGFSAKTKTSLIGSGIMFLWNVFYHVKHHGWEVPDRWWVLNTVAEQALFASLAIFLNPMMASLVFPAAFGLVSRAAAFASAALQPTAFGHLQHMSLMT